MLIRVEELGYTYAVGTPLARTALREVSLEIGPGERVGILGRTGSGKSTLVQLLAGLMAPTAGRVWLDGVPADQRTARARVQRRRVGLAFQNPEHQIFERTVFREVAFGPRNLGLASSEVAERVHWALGQVGLDPAAVEERSPLTLSGGEMRRVALASVLAMRPEVLLLDEPTAGMDPRGRRGLLTRMRALPEEAGVTLVLVSHGLDELARTVDRAILLDEGQVVADGPACQVLSDAELLRDAGMDVPQPTALLWALREAGWDVRTDRVLQEEAVVEIVRGWGQLEVCPAPRDCG